MSPRRTAKAYLAGENAQQVQDPRSGGGGKGAKAARSQDLPSFSDGTILKSPSNERRLAQRVHSEAPPPNRQVKGIESHLRSSRSISPTRPAPALDVTMDSSYSQSNPSPNPRSTGSPGSPRGHRDGFFEVTLPQNVSHTNFFVDEPASAHKVYPVAHPSSYHSRINTEFAIRVALKSHNIKNAEKIISEAKFGHHNDLRWLWEADDALATSIRRREVRRAIYAQDVARCRLKLLLENDSSSGSPSRQTMSPKQKVEAYRTTLQVANKALQLTEAAGISGGDMLRRAMDDVMIMVHHYAADNIERAIRMKDIESLRQSISAARAVGNLAESALCQQAVELLKELEDVKEPEAEGLDECDKALLQIKSHFDRSKMKFQSWFRQFDMDHSGELSVDELEGALKKIGVNMRREALEELVWRVDRNDSGKISMKDLVRATGAATRKKLKLAHVVKQPKKDTLDFLRPYSAR